MVLFDEDPVTLISETTNQFHIAPDRDALTRISGSLHTLQQARALRLDNHHHLLKTLSRRLHHLQSQQTFEEERHDAGRHASEMLRMDTDKFRIAKAASDAEIEVDRLESELAGLTTQLETLERDGLDALGSGGGSGGRHSKVGDGDEAILKLQFFRSLGIDIEQDPVTGVPKRATIRNARRGDVNVIDIDESVSRSSYASTFWDSL